MTYMLDTNICIYAMKKKPEKVLNRFREELDGGLCISSITLAELEYGMKHSSDPVRNEQALLRFPGSVEHPSLWGGGGVGVWGDPSLLAEPWNTDRPAGYVDCCPCACRGNDPGNE